MAFKTKTFRSQQYLNFIDTKPCIVCERMDSTHHHVRIFGGGGIGIKPPDTYCVPICPNCHTRLHQIGERKFWDEYNIDPERKLLEFLTEYIADLPYIEGFEDGD